MNILKSTWLSLTLLVLAIIWLGVYSIYSKDSSSQLTNQSAQNGSKTFSAESTKALAKCLTDKGFKLYGASWCGACKKQRELFGEEAVKPLNYVECAIPNSDEQAESCKQAKIEVYPTWEFPDGTKTPGVMTLKELAKTSGCPIQ